MRRIDRPALPVHAQTYLDRRQTDADALRRKGLLDIDRHWKAARQTQAAALVLGTLRQAIGPRERCMYCVDSHGSDIEHFRPKTRFPAQAYRWSNLLLCCTECGRIKGSQFPMAKRRPLLIDPSAEDPWQHLDFDPCTGNLTARFNAKANDWSAKGASTVGVLHLDRREALAAGHLKTYRRLTAIVHEAMAKLATGSLATVSLWANLQDADDHGLLPWCLRGAGQNEPPFSDLREEHAAVWQAGIDACL